MLRICITFSLLLYAVGLFAQPYYAQIVTNKKDTLDVQVKTDNFMFPNNLIMDIQKKILVVNQGNKSGEYTAKDLLSYRIKIGSKNYTFDSIDGLFFAERLYVGKVMLYKYLKSMMSYDGHEGAAKDYLLRKPNDTKLHEMIANGFSRLINKEQLKRVFADCPESVAKIEGDVIKVKDEDKLIAFVKDYELTCHSK